jgi:hypothetical protein
MFMRIPVMFLLGLLLVAGALLGCVQEKAKEDQAIAEIERLGGKVQRDDE